MKTNNLLKLIGLILVSLFFQFKSIAQCADIIYEHTFVYDSVTTHGVFYAIQVQWKPTSSGASSINVLYKEEREEEYQFTDCISLTGLGSSYIGTNRFLTNIPYDKNINVQIRRHTNGTCGGNICGDTLNFSNEEPLPIKILHFSARVDGRNVRLNWEAIIDEASNGISIERSMDGKYWEELNFISFSPELIDHSKIVNDSYNDMFLEPGMYMYRLKELNNYNAEVMSPIQKIYVSDGYYAECIAYPSYFEELLFLSEDVDISSLKIMSIDGRIVTSSVVAPYQNYLDFSGLSSGIYYIVMKGQDGKVVHYQKVVKSK